MEPQILISMGALLISTMAFFWSRKSFFETNRPIITAEIVAHGAGNTATLFSLAVYNVGNRPACEVRLIANKEEIRKIINRRSMDSLQGRIYKCFSEEAIIPLLHHGKSAKNYFGSSSIIEENNIIFYKSRLPIKILYKDLNGASYKSRLTLIVKNSEGFAGTFWSEPEEGENN